MKIQEAHEKRTGASQIGSHFGAGRHCFSGNSVAERFQGGMFRLHSSGRTQKGQKPLMAYSSAPESCNEPLPCNIEPKISAWHSWESSVRVASQYHQCRPLSPALTAGDSLATLTAALTRQRRRFHMLPSPALAPGSLRLHAKVWARDQAYLGGARGGGPNWGILRWRLGVPARAGGRER